MDPSDTSLMVKKYYRTMTDTTRGLDYLRNRQGIARSMDRLRDVMDRADVQFEKRASFLWDRYKAIWKDMSIQNWRDIFRVSVLEEMARFMIFADFEIARASAISDELSFEDAHDEELGIQLLLQCFVTLSELYTDMRECGRPCPNEIEFRVYHFLLQITPVEGRGLEEKDIRLVMDSFPSDFQRLYPEKSRTLIKLLAAVQKEKWNEIIEVVWKMEFFEFALGRRILDRFRKIRFIKFFKNLRKQDKLKSYPPMPLDRFCELLFLDSRSGMKFAGAYGLNVTLIDGRPTICIKNGYRRPRRGTVPAIGCGIMPWGFIDGSVSVSDFVIQHATESENATLDFAHKQLVWPSYFEALEEWRCIERVYDVSEHTAAVGHQLYQHKLNRLEVVNQIPQLASEVDENGDPASPSDGLPFFRTVLLKEEPAALSRPEEEAEQKTEPSEPVPEELPHISDPSAEKTDLPGDEIEDGEIPIEPDDERLSQFSLDEPRPAGDRLPAEASEIIETPVDPEPFELDRGADVPPPRPETGPDREGDDEVCMSPENTGDLREERATDEGEEPTFEISAGPAPDNAGGEILHTDVSGGQPEAGRARDPLSSVIRERVFSIGEFKNLVGEGRKRSRKSVAVQCDVEDGDEPAIIPFLTPTREDVRTLPPGACNAWREYSRRHREGWNVGRMAWMRRELEFYNRYRERYDRLKDLDEAIPLGWKIPRDVRAQLLDVEEPWAMPRIIPRSFPPRIDEGMLAGRLANQAAVKRHLINPEMARKLVRSRGGEGDFCNFVLLHCGDLGDGTLAQEWIKSRLFVDGAGEESGTVIFESSLENKLNYCCHRCNIEDVSGEDRLRIRNASALFVLLDKRSLTDKILARVAALMEALETPRPPIAVFDATLPPEIVVHENCFLEARERTDVYEKLGRHFDPSDTEAAVVSITEHLEIVGRKIFREICGEWKEETVGEGDARKRLRVKEDSQSAKDYDPVEEGIQSVWRAIVLRAAPNSSSFVAEL